MSEVRVSRRLVLGLAALIVALPAGFAAAVDYRLDSQSRVMHHHTATYGLYNSVGTGDTALRDRIDWARADWDQGLDKVGVPDRSSSTAPGTEIWMRRANEGSTGAAVIFESPFHPESDTNPDNNPPTPVTFNLFYTNDWDATRKRGRACQAIGMLLGLSADPEASRNDCMEDAGTYTQPATRSLDLLDDYYGPVVDAFSDAASGSLYENRYSLKPDRTYSLTGSAQGHGMQTVKIELDGQQVESSSRMPCDERCSHSTSWPVDPGEIAAGDHTVRVVATNEFGVTDERSFEIHMGPPDTGIMRQFTFERESLWDRADLAVNVANGNFVFQQSDLQLAGTTLDLAVGRSYNSMTSRDTGMGPGWAFDTASGIEVKELSSGDVRFFGPSGYAVRFKKGTVSGGVTSYETPTGLDARLTKLSSGGWHLELDQTQERYVFDSQGRFDKHVNKKSDQEIDFQYSGSPSQLSAIQDTQERLVEFAYWSSTGSGGYSGSLKEMKDPTGRNWRYFYDATGQLIRVEVRAAASDTQPFSQTSYGYTNGRLSSITDPNSTGVTSITYDSSGRVSGVTRPSTPQLPTPIDEPDADTAGYTRSFAYSNQPPNGCYKDDTSPIEPTRKEQDYQSTTVTSPRGNETSTSGDYQTVYCHDDQDRVERVIDANGNVQDPEWTSKSNLKGWESGSGADTTLSYNNSLNPSRLTRISEPGGAASTLSYSGYSSDAHSFNPTSVTDPNGNTTSFSYDSGVSEGNVTQIDAPGGTSIDLDHWGDSELGSPPDADWKGLLQSSTLANDADSGGSQITEYKYYGNGPTNNGEAGGRDGNLKEIVPPGTDASPALQGTTTFKYDQLSRVIAIKDGKGVERTITYDPLDRVIAVRYPEDSAQKPDEFKTCLSYDANGNLLTRVDDCDSQGTSTKRDTFEYNRRNLLVIEKPRGGRELRYRFDPDGNMDTQVYQSPNEGIVTFAHDPVNLLTQMVVTPAGLSARTFSYSYNDDNLPTELVFPNQVRQTYDYRLIDDTGDDDNDGETQEPTQDVIAIKAFPPSGSQPTLQHLAYDYDQESFGSYDKDDPSTGLIQRARDLTTGGIATEYDYDGLSRVSEVRENGSVQYRYTYDKASNIKQVQEGTQTRSFEFNKANQVLCSYSGSQQTSCPASNVDYDYDLNGNLVDVDSGNAFAYDKRNRTTGITPFGQTQIPFDYADYSQVDRLSRGSTTFTNTQLGTQIEDTSGSRVFFDRTDSGQPMTMRTASNTYYLLSDVMGSTHALVDGSGQLVGSHYRYEPYGEQITGPSVANPIRFQGQHLDSQTGLYKMGLRYYDPTIGRWTQKDPLNLYQDPRQANRYAFAGGDPINNADPSGLHTLCDSQGCKAVCGIDEDFGDPACQILTGGGNVEACIEGGAKAAGGSFALRSIFSGRFRPPNPLSLLFGCARGAFLESL